MINKQQLNDESEDLKTPNARPLLSKASSTALSVPTIAVSYENANPEITTSLLSPDQRSVFTTTTNTLTEDNQSMMDLNLPNISIPINNTSKQVTYVDLFQRKSEQSISKSQFLSKYIDIDKSNVSDLFHKKLKHFFIFSSAGKPIYSMNGSDEIVIGYMGVLTTIISSFQESPMNTNQHQLKSISIGDCKIIVLYKSPIYLVCISKLTYEIDHNDEILINQLQVVYNYLLSILSKPVIDKNFTNRLNYDLRRILSPLDFENLDELCLSLSYGIDSNRNSLKFSFQTFMNELLKSRQSLKIRHTFKTKIDKLLASSVDAKDDDLLFSLFTVENIIINYKKLKHLHNLSIQDINLLMFIIISVKRNEKFQSANQKEEEEDLWIPLCMPGFNKNGFLYMYVQSWSIYTIILISGNKNSFYNLKNTAQQMIIKLESEKFSEMIYRMTHDIQIPLDLDIPFVIKHFVYKDIQLGQYIMSELPQMDEDPDWNLQLVYYYTTLKYNRSLLINKDVHEYKKLSYFKIENISGYMICDQSYEFFCICNDTINSKKLLQLSSQMIKWCKKNRNRLFLTI